MSPQPASPPKPGHPFAPFRYPAFRAIWIANLTSNLGSMVQSVAAAWLMTELTTSHQLIALVQASVTIPVMLLGVFAGAIADNYDRRLVMLWAQAGMLVVSALLAVLTYAGSIGPFLLLAFTLLMGCGSALNGPAWQASVRLQVGPTDLPQAISLNTIAFNLARSVGPALGGLLISLTSPALAFALNALSFVALIVVLLRWRPEAPALTRRPILASVVQGLRYCAESSPLRRILVRGLAFGFCAAGYQAMMPVLVRERLHGSEIVFGLVLGAFGIGSIVTALWVAPLRRRFGSEAVTIAASLVYAVALAAVAFAPGLGWAIAAALLAGGGWVSVLTTLNVAMQLRSPEAILGRCLAIYQATTFGGMALGSYTMGLASDAIGLVPALTLFAVLMAASALILPIFFPMPGRGEGHVSATGAT
ncbi:MAG: MFS transporter [Sphingomonadales bacterium]|nr:MFS transporter [Sphingomonadales bacterium]